MDPVLLSSKSNDWETPPAFFEALNLEFQFNLDPCCTPETAKTPTYFTKEQDGLKQSWEGYRVFCNPPYGREIGKWVKKAYEESLKGALVVLLVPARTDTSYWHDYITKGEIRFIRGRLHFSNSKAPAPFPSVIVIFRGDLIWKQ